MVYVSKNKFASKSLTKTERSYAVIEKEILAVLIGCNRFSQYITGQAVTVETDHMPLEKMMQYTMSGWPTNFNSEMNEYHI
jgi:hypothetical protein